MTSEKFLDFTQHQKTVGASPVLVNSTKERLVLKPWPLGRGGFTLTELLVVIAVLGVLFSIAYIIYTDSLRKADDTERVIMVKAMQDAVELYIEDYGYPPEVRFYLQEEEIWNSFAADLSQYMDNVPVYSPSLDYPFGYCNNSTDRRDYMVGVLLDYPREMVGDIDGEQIGYDCGQCIFNSGSQVCPDHPICNDDHTGYFRNRFGPVFCLGHESL